MTLRRTLRLCLILMAVLVGASTPNTRQGASGDLDAVASQEVRIRKLHLVRPDLLPYPLFYEVVC